MISPYLFLRPYIWVALTAFVIGFAGFLALGGAAARANPAAERILTPASAPTYYPGAGPVRAV